MLRSSSDPCYFSNGAIQIMWAKLKNKHFVCVCAAEMAEICLEKDRNEQKHYLLIATR